MSKCVHESKLHDNRWCSAACMYCTLSQEEMCRHKKHVPVTDVAKTNADHIRSMTDGQLAAFLIRGAEEEIFFIDEAIGGSCDGWLEREELLDWLKQPYKEDV